MLCSKSWLKVGMGEHMMGGVGEKGGQVEVPGLPKGRKCSPVIEKWSSG